MDAISLLPAADNDESISELAVIRSVSDNPGATTLHLLEPLENLYDRSTVTIYGNVVPATHGQTVADELLGTSEAMGQSQQFLLKQQPLTFTSAATTTGADSNLSIYINGIEWEEVPSLSGLSLDRRAFMIRRDVKGNTTVIFGDGQEGAGIPSGTDQITATYRIGLGQAGNVPANRLNLLQGLVAGAKGAVSDIKAVTNPIEASGGADPETMETARWHAPMPLQHLQRIVSLTDFEDFARTFAGIGKAKISQIATGSTTLLHLTIAGTDGAVVRKDSKLYTNLLSAIEVNRALPTPSIKVDSFEPLYFNVKARLIIEPDQHERQADIKTEAENALRNAFCFARREFGQSVAASEVITILQKIRGVLAVELSQFYVRELAAQLNRSLEAQLARSDKGQVFPAQMLLINLTLHEGIILEIDP
jgi:predicted phage baseplate assembly protein